MRPARRVTPALRLALLTGLVLLAPTVPQAARAASAAPAGPTTGTFFWANAWAAHHTAAHGATSGPARMRRLVRLVERAHLGLGVLAEVERPQSATFRRAAPAYRLFTGGHGNTNAVFWRADRYELVDTYRFRSFTYRGTRNRLPVVVLRDRASAAELAVIAVHNPRDGWRARALRRELREVRHLRNAYGAQLRVFVAGDFNAGASVACAAHRARLYSAGNPRCHGHAPIDQLLVDRRVGTSHYRSLSPSRHGRITDHPALYRVRFAFDATTEER
jgi:hypothetical protein